MSLSGISQFKLPLLEKAFAVCPSAILITNIDDTILAVNPAFCHLTGYQQSEVVGKSLQLIRSDKHEAEFFAAIWRQLKQAGCWSGEVWNRSKFANVIPMIETIYTFCENGQQISHLITTLVDKSEAHDAQILINYLASRDSLTGLANRLSAQSYFEAAAFEQKQALQKIAVICLGLDRFKDVNDALGRGVGDQLLIRVAGYLTHMVADNGIVSRSGGDEFLVILRDARDIVQLSALMQQMVSGIDTVQMAEHTNLSVTTSIGVAVFPDDAFNFDTLLKYADIALHSSKSAGGNQYCIFSPELETRVQQRLQMESLAKQ